MSNYAETSYLTESQEQKTTRLKRITMELIKCCVIVSIPSLIAGFTLVSGDAIYQPIIRFLINLDFWHTTGIAESSTGLRSYLNYMFRKELPLFRLQKALLAGFAIIGALGAKYLLISMGARRTLLLQYLIALVGWSITLFTLFFDLPLVFMLARPLHGLHIGLVSVCVPIYLNELAHISVQGICGCFHYLFAVFGILLAYVFGVSNESFKVSFNYIILAMSLFPIVLTIAGFLLAKYFLSESPKYIFIREQDPESCKRVLLNLRRDDNIDQELEAIRHEARSNNGKDLGFSDLLSTPYRQILYYAVGLQILHQLCALSSDFVFTVMYHELEDWYFKGTAIIYCLVQIFSVIMCLAFIELLGRKLLLIYSVLLVGSYDIIQAITTVGELAAYIVQYVSSVVGVWYDIELIVDFLWKNMFLVAASCALVCIVFNGIGIGPIAYIYPVELFDFRAKTTAMSMCMAFNWLLHLIFPIVFSQLYLFIEFYSFLMLGAFIIIIFVFMVKRMPETRFRMRYEYFPTTEQQQPNQ